ncbi:MAG TPA: hypothetical protein ENN43_04945, partial [bacterium]|nr:hypothetical protein [bacterium]
MLKKAAMAVFTLILYVYPVSAETLDAEKFIRIASENDIRFELLLADEMKAKYIRGLLEPPADILASVRGNYAFNLPGQDRENRSLSVSLSKLFPRIGSARLSAYYSHNESAAAGAQASAAGISASLPVIRNGFGFVDRILIDIAGYEQEIAVMQAVDAYEDYMAYLLKLYYSWYSSYA